MVARIKALALEHPAYGCNRHEAMLALEGTRVSSITIQKILNDSGLGTRTERWLALETANAGKVIEITSEQAAFLEKLNPCFRERHVESAAPGELLSADTFFVGALKGVGRVYLHAVVDTYGSHAFGFLHVSKQPEAAVAVLHNDVLPFYRKLDLLVAAPPCSTSSISTPPSALDKPSGMSQGTPGRGRPPPAVRFPSAP